MGTRGAYVVGRCRDFHLDIRIRRGCQSLPDEPHVRDEFGAVAEAAESEEAEEMMAAEDDE
ncbi:MAG TPA: hypothetical protein VMX94_02950 [Armatimonadota bacterium]|nr:hypothetical protein [Armatimonadota bacterium]